MFARPLAASPMTWPTKSLALWGPLSGPAFATGTLPLAVARSVTIAGAFALSFAVAMVAVVAPSPVGAQTQSSAAPSPAPTPPAPEIFFRAPVNGARVNPTFDVVFGLRNYGVAPATVNLARTGHFHVLINVEPGAPGTVVPADSLHRHFGAGQIETKLTLAPGTYTLRLVLADYEHKVIGPALNSAPIRITVLAPR